MSAPRGPAPPRPSARTPVRGVPRAKLDSQTETRQLERRSKARPKAVLALTLGCPAGVGPEVAVRAAAQSDRSVVLFGDRRVVDRAAEMVGVQTERIRTVTDPRAPLPRGVIGHFSESERVSSLPPPGRAGRSCAVQLVWLQQALAVIQAGGCDALVTGPVSKDIVARWALPSFRGHTEWLQAELGAEEVVMAFWSEALTTALATTHLPLADVARTLESRHVASATFWLARLLADLRGARSQIAIAALNPHAGEGGLLGTEERRVITPGIRAANERIAREGVDVEITGPLGAETAFRRAVRGDFDGVVAMYHDQATIPMKLVGFGDAVNVTLGLPIVRTSVDHGTGYDIAGMGRADPRGMVAAIDLAARLAARRASSLSSSP